MKFLAIAFVWVLSHQVLAFNSKTVTLHTSMGDVVMHRAQCANGKWMDWDTGPKRDAGGASFCKSVGSSMTTVTTVTKNNPSPGRPPINPRSGQDFSVTRVGTFPDGLPKFQQKCDDGFVTNHTFNNYNDAVVSGSRNCRGHDK